MRVYDYVCNCCEHKFELFVKGPTYDYAKCPECKRTATRIPSDRRDHTVLEG